MTTSQRVRLGDVCVQEREVIKPGERPDLRYIGLESIEAETGRFVEGELSKTPEEPRAISFGFTSDHVLYGKLRPYLNKVALPDFAGKCSTEIVPLRPGPRVDRAYAAYFLRADDTVSRINARTAGARMPRADMGMVLRLELSLPSPDEQRRIVDTLSRAEGIVRLLREAQTKAAELIPALFLDMFGDPATNPRGWKTVRLGDLAEKMSDGPFGSNLKTSHYVQAGVRVLRLQNIGVGYFNDADRAYVSPAHFETLPRHHCLPGDVIIATLGDPNLRACILPDSIPQALNKADCVQFKCRANAADPEYICWLMNMPSTLAMAASLVQGITRTRISMGRLRELVVPIPALAVQKMFADRARQMRSIQSQQGVAAATVKEAFNALLSRTFATNANG